MTVLIFILYITNIISCIIGILYFKAFRYYTKEPYLDPKDGWCFKRSDWKTCKLELKYYIGLFILLLIPGIGTLFIAPILIDSAKEILEEIEYVEIRPEFKRINNIIKNIKNFFNKKL